MKYFSFLVLAVLLAISVNAISSVDVGGYSDIGNIICYADTSCEFVSVSYNGSGYHGATEVRTTLMDINGTLIFENKTMTEISTGIYYYNYTINQSGLYIRETTFDEVYITSEQVIVEDYSSVDIAHICMALLSVTITSGFVILMFGLILYIFNSLRR